MDIVDDDVLEGDERFWGQLRFPAASATPSNVLLGSDVASADILENDGKCLFECPRKSFLCYLVSNTNPITVTIILLKSCF